MTSPGQSRWGRWAAWLALPVVGFGVGVVLSLGLRSPALRANYVSLFHEGLCELAALRRAIVSGSWPQRPVCDDVPSVAAWRSLPPWPTAALQPDITSWSAAIAVAHWRYPVTTPPPFRAERATASSPALTQILEQVMAQIQAQGLPVEAVSLSLVDLTGDCCAYAGYQDQTPRYPASIVKLFWLVALYGHYDTGRLQPEVDVQIEDEALMAHYSDNGASSRIVDALTQTQSGAALGTAALAEWMAARQTLNAAFLAANYPDLNIVHKTLPILDLGIETRTGRDQQFADRVAAASGAIAPDRNYLTTAAVARLLYEIDTDQAVAPQWRDRLRQHLRHSTDPDVWQREAWNAIAGFFGASLPPDTELYTKLGFTFDDGRQEAAIIATPDGRTRFILVMFANDPAYSQDETLFPLVARTVYDQMQRRPAARSTVPYGGVRADTVRPFVSFCYRNCDA